MSGITLFIHITAGSIALVAALAAIISQKGATIHRYAGRFYTAAMMATAATAIGLAVLDLNVFLLVIGLFSFYLVFTGWRAAVERTGQPTGVDWLVGATMAILGVGMIVWGSSGLLAGVYHPHLVLVIFGIIGIVLAAQDAFAWRQGPVTGQDRIVRHLTRMMGGTIATVTAVAVVNLPQLPSVVTWLGPTALMVPLIVLWTGRVRHRRGAVIRE